MTPDLTPKSGRRDLDRLLGRLRRELLDLTARNRLVHVNRTRKQAMVINVIAERSGTVYAALRKGRKLRFQPTHDDDARRARRRQPPFPPLAAPPLRQGPSQLHLQTDLPRKLLDRRLLRLYLDSRTREEEHGANFLFLALGFLRWYEDANSSEPREAPLVLLPVQLERLANEFTYNLRVRPDDVTTNLPLQQRLTRDFGIDLPDIDDSEDWTPADYFHRVTRTVFGRPRWSIDAAGMQLGFFSFAKALMYRDLLDKNWPEHALLDHPLVRGLLDSECELENAPPLLNRTDPLDGPLPPAKVFHVLDADASQARVIEEARQSRNLVVQGPPGTGKSQTIANIIAAAAHDGKTVLFMAEKMAALTVVHTRLRTVGLADICLELHSRMANKKAFYGELKRTLEAGRAVPAMPSEPHRLQEARDSLNDDDALLHQPLEGRDYTPFAVIAELSSLTGQNVSPPEPELPQLGELSQRDIDERRDSVRRFAAAAISAGPPEEHPFVGTRNLDLQPTDVARLRGELKEAQDAVDRLSRTVAEFSGPLEVASCISMVTTEHLVRFLAGVQRAPERARRAAVVFAACDDIERLRNGLDLFLSWKSLRDSVADKFRDTAWHTRVQPIREGIRGGVESWKKWAFGTYRSSSRELSTLLRGKLPRRAAPRLELLDELIRVQRARTAWAQDKTWLAAAVGELWRGESTDVDALRAAGSWCTSIRDPLRQLDRALTRDTVDVAYALKDRAPALLARLKDARTAARERAERVDKRLALAPEQAIAHHTPLHTLADRLARMHAQLGRYEQWRRLQRTRRLLASNGLGEFGAWLAAHGTSAEAAEKQFRYCVADARWRQVRTIRPELDTLRDTDRHRRVEAFQDLDRERLRDVSTLIRSRHLAQLPTGAAGEMAFLRGEFGKKVRHRPVRTAFEAASNMIPRIKPVILMSPISIAQFLPPGKIDFDLLLIDEASQVRPADALGGVARAKQIVVVGDHRQLPPTSFFERYGLDGRDDDGGDRDRIRAAGAQEMESILTLAEARGLKRKVLEWHYRSRDPSLIQMSNQEFYDSRLVLPPSPREKDERFGMKLNRVPGVYSSRSTGDGRAGTNRVEAERIVDALLTHAESTATRKQSFGVVAFSKAQSDMIADVLDARRRNTRGLDALLRESGNEDVFVKNLENVQGDERDVILVSVGYGPRTPGGVLPSHRFGPVNNKGGERRLNVLFTRARTRCEIFVSFDWRDIDPKRTQSRGVKTLKAFLEFAETGKRDSEPAPTGRDPDSPLEKDVAREIRTLGYPVDHQVGTQGFRIDLGVRHPHRTRSYILAVECDGATYHSALWARERDRLRQELLENHGWRFHRIWSTDWFHRRGAEIDRLRKALSTAAAEAERGIRPLGANQPCNGQRHAALEAPAKADDDMSARKPPPARGPSRYTPAVVGRVSSEAPHEVTSRTMRDLVERIVGAEGPMHEALVARRVAETFGTRTGPLVVGAAKKGLQSARRRGAIRRSGDFCMTAAQQEKPPLRHRSGQKTEVRKPEHLPPIEVRRAAEWVTLENGVVKGVELVRAVARVLGYQRTGKKLQARIERILADRFHPS